MHLISRVLTALLFAMSASAQIYVSPRGSDQNPGTAAKPVASIQHAMELSRQAKTHEVVLRGGVYRLTESIRIAQADSGVALKAAHGEHPVISGAVRISGWQRANAGVNVWTARVPESVVSTRQIYVNGVRATRTQGRVPVELTETPTGYTAAAATMASWRNPSGMEFVYTGGNSIWSERSEGLGSWTEPRCPVHSINGTTITMAQPCWDNSTKRVMLPNGARTANLVGPMSVGKRPEYVENAYELLGTPGQFYFDRPSHTIYYVPRAAEDLKTADVELPVLETLVEGAGTASAPIENVTFSGIQFA